MGEKRIKRVGHSVYMHACERLSTDSTPGRSRWVTDMLEFAAMPQRRVHPSAGMSRITTTAACITDWTYYIRPRWMNCNALKTNNGQKSELWNPFRLVNVESVCTVCTRLKCFSFCWILISSWPICVFWLQTESQKARSTLTAVCLTPFFGLFEQVWV